jgi:hypothetical protein
MSQERFVRIILIFSSQKTKMVPSMGQTIPLLRLDLTNVSGQQLVSRKERSLIVFHQLFIHKGVTLLTPKRNK